MKNFYSFGIQRAFLSLVLILGGVFFTSVAAEAATNVSGLIVTPTTWTKANSPYVVTANITVSSKLTIEEDVVVKMGTGHLITVSSDGSLEAEGVTFTSIYDDEHGGEINGAPSTQAPNVSRAWGAIASSGSLSINDSKFYYGGRTTRAMVEVTNGTGTITDNDFRYANNGFIQNNGFAIVRGNTYRDIEQHAVWQKNGTITFGDNQFANITRDSYLLVADTFTNEGGNSGDKAINFQNNFIFKNDKTLPEDGLPYQFQQVKINSGVTLNLEEGSVVKFINATNSIDNHGTLKAEGTEENPIFFTSSEDDEVGGDSNNNDEATFPASGQWGRIYNNASGNIEFTYTTLRYGGASGLSETGLIINYGSLEANNSYFTDSKTSLLNVKGGSVNIEKSELSRAEEGVVSNGQGTIAIHNSDLLDTESYRIRNSSSGNAADASNNYWGDEDGPIVNGTDGPRITTNVLYDPFRTSEAICKTDCFSSVLFLPGIKASRLYTVVGPYDMTLWEPDHFDDLSFLEMDENGESKSNGIFTGDVIDEELGYATNIYKSFLHQLIDLKASGDINDYNSFAYDWRYDVRDIVEDGTQYRDGIENPVSEALELAQGSKSGKVTIIAHSNGGLLAKAIMQKLEENGQEAVVDKLILVGSPQMGTPTALLSFLYGHKESVGPAGIFVSQENARKFAENIPGAYSLLPSEEYYSRVGDAIVQFEDTSTHYQDYKDFYGSGITTWQEFVDFALGEEGREKPGTDELTKENVLNEYLLNKAKETHDALDSWQPPSTLQVIQIAGVGIDTISGVKYVKREKQSCIGIGSLKRCKGNGEYDTVYEPLMSTDGDKVVVSPSALMLEEGSKVKNYYIDLEESNTTFTLGRAHKNISEIASVLTFLEGEIKNNLNTLPSYFYKIYPLADSRLRMRVYSPLDVHLYDTHGNHTGPKEVTVNGITTNTIEESIPNSYYYVFGERKYIGVPSGQEIQVVYDGYAEGAYTIEIDELKDGQTDTIIFSNLPAESNTIANLTISSNGISDLPRLTSDIDGDSIKDFDLVPIINKSVTLANIESIPETSSSSDTGSDNSDSDDSDSDNESKTSSSQVYLESPVSGESLNSANIDTLYDEEVQAQEVGATQKGQQSENENNQSSSTPVSGLPAFFAIKGTRVDRLLLGLGRFLKLKKGI